MIFQGEASFVIFLFSRAKITRNEAEFWTKEAEKTSCEPVTMANKGKIFGFKNKIKQLNK